MKVYLNSDGYFYKCPIWWKNFIRKIKSDLNLDKFDELLDKDFQEAVKKANFIVVYTDHGLRRIDHLLFKSDEDFLFFKLKWI